MIVLTGLVLVFSRQMRVEALASGNLLASVQADAVVDGAARYVVNCLANNTDQSTLDSEIQSEAVPLGDGMFWIIRPNPDDERQYAFGVVGENSKLDLNSATADMLLCLPGMTADLADCIVDWREPQGSGSDTGGMEDNYYSQLPEPYSCKYAPFETLDELLLVKSATRDVLYGVDANRNGVVDEDEAGQQGPLTNFNGLGQCGVCKYLTVYSAEPAAASAPQAGKGNTNTKTNTNTNTKTNTATKVVSAAPVVGRININTAPREVLLCLPGLTASDADQLIAVRTANGADLSSVAWVAKVLAPATLAKIASLITVKSYQFSADIVSVSGNGRGFKRVKYVFDMRTTPMLVRYRQDLTHLGWPLAPAILEALRAGTQVPVSAAQSFSLGKQ